MMSYQWRQWCQIIWHHSTSTSHIDWEVLLTISGGNIPRASSIKVRTSRGTITITFFHYFSHNFLFWKLVTTPWCTLHRASANYTALCPNTTSTPTPQCIVTALCHPVHLLLLLSASSPHCAIPSIYSHSSVHRHRTVPSRPSTPTPQCIVTALYRPSTPNPQYIITALYCPSTPTPQCIVTALYRLIYSYSP